MHELSLAQGIVTLVEDHVSEEERPRVRAIQVRVGALSGVVADSLDFCFTAIVADTPLAGARLAIEAVPVRLCCQPCGRTFAVEGLVFSCPACGGGETRVESGSELMVATIEVEEEEPEVA